jgi:predicted extracellular nuclease
MKLAFQPTVFLVAALLLVAHAAAQNTPPDCSDGKCVQVGSYNIELLGKDRQPFEGEDRGDRTDAELERLADRVATKLDLEIVVFQEINTGSNQWKALRDKLKAKGYQFFEGTSSEREQFVVLAWDADEVSLVDNSAQELDVRADFDFGAECQEEGLRKPVAGRFKAGEFDFWVIGVHLKSRSGEEPCNTRIRTEQCKDLKKEIDDTIGAAGERDILIVGDYNERPGHASFQPLVDAGFTTQMKFLMPGSAKGSFVKNRDLHQSVDLIDQVMLRFTDTQELVRHSAFVMPLGSEDEAKDYIIEQSDHVPVCVSFRIDTDLDGTN